jgi:hypothetical protein
MCQYGRAGKVVDSHYIDSFHVVDLAENKATNTPESIDGNFNSTHNNNLKMRRIFSVAKLQDVTELRDYFKKSN